MYDAEPLSVEYNDDLSFPFEKFMESISGGVKLTAIVNPNNPTGSVLNPERLLQIVQKAAEKDVLTIVDEAYFYFYPETVMEHVKSYSNLIVLRTFSKVCGMASLRLGYAAACSRIIESLIKVKPTFDVNGIAVLFAEKLIDNPDIIQHMINDVNEGREYLKYELSKSNIPYIAGNANFILINCAGRVNEIMRRLSEKRVLVAGGFAFPFLKDYIRVTVGTKSDMEKFWESFSDIWRN